MDEFDARGRALEAERARPDTGERVTIRVPVEGLLAELIGVLAGALLDDPEPHGCTRAAAERRAEYDRLRRLGFSPQQAAEDVGVYSPTTINRYENERQGAA